MRKSDINHYISYFYIFLIFLLKLFLGIIPTLIYTLGNK